MTSSTVAWPDAGEIDIIEGVNDEAPNTSTLHTLQGCTMSNSTVVQTGYDSLFALLYSRSVYLLTVDEQNAGDDRLLLGGQRERRVRHEAQQG